jgi:hypothetical protein
MNQCHQYLKVNLENVPNLTYLRLGEVCFQKFKHHSWLETSAFLLISQIIDYDQGFRHY